MMAMELVWRRRLMACILVTCYFLYDIKQDDNNNPSDNATATSIEVVATNSTTTNNTNTNAVKTPVCATPPNWSCVKPYFPPQPTACTSHADVRVDSNGAWYLPANFMYKFDRSMADAILDKVIAADGESMNSVLELGAGLGCYTHYFRDSQKIASITAYEGAANVEEMSEGFINQADLTKPQTQTNPHFESNSHDWVLCMEVAEHIPSQHQYTFLMNVLTPARKGVLLTWGVPGQSGRGHVNLRTNDYVVDLLKSLGFEYDEETSEYLREQSLSTWFKGSTMVFRNRNYVEGG